jgi:hypothetical protein
MAGAPLLTRTRPPAAPAPRRSAMLAHVLLGERLPALGWLGCALCICGSVPLVLHAPPEQPVASVAELWALAAQPLFVWYVLTLLAGVALLVLRYEPRHGGSSPLVALAICSLMGSLSVLSCKALGTALRLTLAGSNQLAAGGTWALVACVVVCVVTQMAYLNKALDSFPTALVTPVYYVLFTSATLAASAVLFQDWRRVSGVAATTQTCAFLTILAGVGLLHAAPRDADGAALAAALAGGGVAAQGAGGKAAAAMLPVTTLPSRGSSSAARGIGVAMARLNGGDGGDGDVERHR